MTETQTPSNAESVQDTPLTIREHLDPDKHWIGEALAPPSQTEISATVGVTASPGESPFVARADHLHKIDAYLLPQYFSIFPGSTVDATTGTSMTTWLTSSNLWIPSWATGCTIQVNLTGFYVVTAVATYYLTATISGISYPALDSAIFSLPTFSERHALSFAVPLADITAVRNSTRTVLVGARRTTGTGTLRADGSTQCTGFVIFKP